MAKKKDRYIIDKGRIGEKVAIYDRLTGLCYDPEMFTMRKGKIVRRKDLRKVS